MGGKLGAKGRRKDGGGKDKEVVRQAGELGWEVGGGMGLSVDGHWECTCEGGGTGFEFTNICFINLK
jgi:hypothetical protein